MMPVNTVWFRSAITSSVLLALWGCSSVLAAAKDSPINSESFWLWFDRYADEQGNVTDPLEINEMLTLQTQADSVTVNDHTQTSSNASATTLQNTETSHSKTETEGFSP